MAGCFRFRVIATLAAVIVATPFLHGQGRPYSAEESLKRLAAPTLAEEMELSPCSISRQLSPMVDDLVRHGPQALPEVERAVDSLESNAAASPYRVLAGYLLGAYARMKGQDAMPRLLRLRESSRGSALRNDASGAIGVALGLTDYIASGDKPGRVFHCDGGEHPKDAASLFIRAWLDGDRAWLERNLTEGSRRQLAGLAGSGNWQEFRGRYWRAGSDPDMAVGYRLKLPESGWRNNTAPMAEVEMVDRVGKVCGRTSLAIRRDSEAGDSAEFHVETKELDSFLRLVTECATRQAGAAPGDEKALVAFLRAYCGLDEPDYDKTTRYTAAWVDLNGDGTPEVLVHMSGRFWCGTGGCPLLILERQKSGYRLVTKATIVHRPVRVLNSRSHGWRSIGVRVHGGGIIKGYEAELRFDGRRYPSNPSMPPARRLERKVEGEIVIDYSDPDPLLYP
jgi:hypothetical protein